MKVNCVSQYLEHRQRSAPQKQKNGGLLGWNNTLSTNEPKDCPCKPAHARLRWRTALRHRGGRAECIRGIWICYYSSLWLFVHYCLPLFLLIFLIYFSQPFLSIPIHSYLFLFSFPTYSIFICFQLLLCVLTYSYFFHSFSSILTHYSAFLIHSISALSFFLFSPTHCYSFLLFFTFVYYYVFWSIFIHSCSFLFINFHSQLLSCILIDSYLFLFVLFVAHTCSYFLFFLFVSILYFLASSFFHPVSLIQLYFYLFLFGLPFLIYSYSLISVCLIHSCLSFQSYLFLSIPMHSDLFLFILVNLFIFSCFFCFLFCYIQFCFS